MKPSEIRRIVIVAMFSDDLLMDVLVLKGGNALDIVHGLTARGSLDIDFSIEADFADVPDVKRRIFAALRDRFDSVGFHVFDENFMQKPSELREGQDERWGGYRVEFKVIPKAVAARVNEDLEGMRKNAEVIGFAQEKIFRIEISKYEFCRPKVETELDEYTIYVYTPQMIAAEKLRALCQQMPEYAAVKNKRARARDFYDVHTIVTRIGLDLGSEDFHDLVRAIFSAKDVPLSSIPKIAAQKEFHKPDWPSVQLALTEEAEDFDFYFNFVVEQLQKLKPLWDK